MITPSIGSKRAVEERIHSEYKRLAEYAARANASAGYVAAQKNTLDTFTQGWNEQEDRIEELEREVEILRQRAQLSVEQRTKIYRPATQYDWMIMLSRAMVYRVPSNVVSRTVPSTAGQATILKVKATYVDTDELVSREREKKRAIWLEEKKARWPELY